MDTFALTLPLAIAAAAPPLIWLFRRSPNLREAVSFTAAALVFLSMLPLAAAVLSGRIPQATLCTLYPGISLSLQADGLSVLFGLIAPFLWGFATSYNIGYMRGLDEHAQTRYYFCFALAIFGAVGVALSATVFTLYLFYELITIFTYPLVAHHQDESAFAGAQKYMTYLMGTSKLFLLPAMILTYVLCGTLDMRVGDIAAGMFPKDADPRLVTLTYFLYIAGLAKAAIIPFHNWLPSAMVAPTPVSALLHAVAVVKAGVFSVSRIMLSGFGVETLTSLNLGLPTAFVASLTILAASVIALTKTDLKARLAYSTVSQLSYVVLGLSLLTPDGIQGGIVHIAVHAFSKITLFFCAGAIYVAAHKKNINDMSGLGRTMPFTFAAFGVASLSMIGAPPVAGFVTKWKLLVGAMEMPAYSTAILLVLLASTLLNVAYFAPVTYSAFFGKAPVGDGSGGGHGGARAGIHEAPLTMLVPLLLTATLSVAIGLFPDTFMLFVKAVAR
jgi:multicomponent Na+:H+ antiporter subunit D